MNMNKGLKSRKQMSESPNDKQKRFTDQQIFFYRISLSRELESMLSQMVNGISLGIDVSEIEAGPSTY